MSAFHYKRSPLGRLIWSTPDGDVPLDGGRLAVAFDVPADPAMMVTLLKHGTPSDMAAWLGRFTSKSQAKHTTTVLSGELEGRVYDGLLGRTLYVEGLLGIDEINQAIACTGYVPGFIREMIEMLAQPEAEVVDHG